MPESATIADTAAHAAPTATKVKVKLPGPLKAVTPIGAEFSFQGGNVADLFREIDRAHPGFLGRITEPGGKVRPYLGVFVNGKSANSLRGMDTPLCEGDTLTVMLSFAGG